MLGPHLITWDFSNLFLLGSPHTSQAPLQLRLLAACWALCPLPRGFTLLLGCGSVSSCQSPLHLSFAGQKKAPGRNHHLRSCESHSVGCNPSLPGRKNSEWPYKKGRASPQNRFPQAEAVRAGRKISDLCLWFIWDKISGWRFLCPLC